MFDIYIVTHRDSGRLYIGKSTNFERRWREHLSFARRGGWTPICEAIQEYGADAFDVDLVARFYDESDAFDFECHMIATKNSRIPTGFNVQRGGEGNTGQSAMRGRHLSEETKAKISASRKGHKHSEESKQKMSLRMRGNSFRRGIKHSPEVRAKISEALRRAHAAKKAL